MQQPLDEACHGIILPHNNSLESIVVLWPNTIELLNTPRIVIVPYLWYYPPRRHVIANGRIGYSGRIDPSSARILL